MGCSTVCLSSIVVLLVVVLCSTIPADAARQRSKVIPDIASTVYSENLHGDRKCYERRVRDPNVHISARLLRYFTFGGILQGIAEKTALPRVGLVQGGASQYQDRSSGLQREYHAAHIVRVGTIEPRLQKESATLYNALKNYIGHTQNVVRHANVWHGVGGQIDRFQSDNLAELAKIDFNGALDGQIQTVEGLVLKFRELIQKYVQAPDGTRTESDQSVLNEDWVAVWCAGTEVLFEAGKEGYQLVMSGNFVDHYTTS